MRSAAFLLLGVAALLTGCEPRVHSTVPSHKDIDGALAVVQATRRTGSPLLTLEELKHMIGEPDGTVTASELHRRVSAEWAAKSPDYAQTIMVRAFRQYADAGRSTQDNWQECKEFLGCSIWVYRWDHPGQLYQGGGLSSPVGRYSCYFIVSDDRLIGAGRVVRNGGR
jgi:hypothetical protein